MASYGNASFFLSATNPGSGVAPDSEIAGPETPTPSDGDGATAPPTLGAGEEPAKRVLLALQNGPIEASSLTSYVSIAPAQVEPTIAYLREAGMLEDAPGGRLALSSFAQDAVKLLG